MQRGKKNVPHYQDKNQTIKTDINDGDDKISSNNFKLPIINMFKD